MIHFISRYAHIGTPIFRGRFFFILGSGRSGNTLLRKIFMDEYDVYIPAETYVLAESLEAFNRSWHLRWADRVRMVLGAFEYQSDFHTICRSGLYPVFEKCVSLPKAKRSFGEIINCLWDFLSKDAGVKFSIPGDKTPYNMVSIMSISRAFPNGKYLFVTRHPYDVCASYVKMGRYSDVEAAAHRWVLAHNNWKRLKRRYPKLSCMQICYEDLVRNPEQITHKVAEWLGAEKRAKPLKKNTFWGDIDVYDHISGVKSEINDKSIGKGAGALNHGEKDIIKQIVGNTAFEFKYDI